MIWNISKVHNMTGKYEFKINRNHVLIKDILNQVKGDKKLEKAVDSLIKLAESRAITKFCLSNSFCISVNFFKVLLSSALSFEESCLMNCI